MSDLGRLIYKQNDGSLAFKQGDGHLAYKASSPGVTTVSFGWSSKGSDLDICGYWLGAPNTKVGYNYQSSAGTYTDGDYTIQYSGDIRSVSGTEWVKLTKSNWTASETFRVYFNFYGYSSSYPGNTCNVIASQLGGVTRVKQNQAANTEAGQPAPSSGTSYYCDIVFSADGKLVRID